MNFPQVFDTWDSGSHGLVASLSRSLVLGSSSPRIGLLVAFWATFQARALRRNWARACFVVALSCVRIREHRDLVCARDRFQSRHQFISSVVFPSHPPGDFAGAFRFGFRFFGGEERGICGLVLVRVGQWRGEYVYSSPTWPVLSTALPSAPTSLPTWGLLEAATS